MDNKILAIKEKVKQNKGLIQNFSYLTALQVFNMLVPLFTYPYLIRVLGKEKYGLVIYAQVVVGYLVLLISFGFNSSGVREISIHRDNKIKLSETTCSILILKSLFFILSLLILGVIINFLPQAKEYRLLFILSMWIGLYDVIFPVWYFQGVEKMKYITYLTLLSRSIFIILIFVLISKPEHYLRVPIINGTGGIISGVIALIILFKNEKLFLVRPSLSIIKLHFLDSINFFISEVSVKIFNDSNKLIIGSFLGVVELAYYDLADKIVNLFRGIPVSIVRSTIYPNVAKTKNIYLVKKTTIIMSFYSIFAILIINIFTPSIVIILGGKEMLPSVPIIRLLSILIFTTHLYNYFCTVGLWSLGYEKVFRNMMIYSSLLYLIIYCVLWFLNTINLYSIAAAPIIVDTYLIFHVYFFWWKKGLMPKKII